MQSLEHNKVAEALNGWELHQACKIRFSFRAMAMSSTSRGAIAAGCGIGSMQRKLVLLKVASAIGLTGIIEV